MSGVSIHREKEPFFGGDGRSRLFTAFFFPTRNFREVINNDDANRIVGTSAWSVMSAANHENSGMNDNDIHPDFTDFIVQTALFHRELDKSTKTGTVVDQLWQNIYNAVYNALLIPSGNFGTISSASLNLQQPAINPSQGNQGTVIESILHQNPTNYQILNAILMSLGKDRPLNSSVDINTNLDFNTFGQNSLSNYVNTFLDQ